MSALLVGWTQWVEMMAFGVWHYPDAVLKQMRQEKTKPAK